MTTTTKPFPLLRLPSLAINEFLKQIGPSEQFQLSLTSKKTRNTVKQFARWMPISFHLKLIRSSFSMEFYRTKSDVLRLTVSLEESKDLNSPKSELRFDKVTVPVDYCIRNNARCITTYWKDKVEGVKHLLSHFLDVFNLIISLDIWNQKEHLVSEILTKLQDSRMEYFYFNAADSSDHLYQQMLNLSCNELILFVNPSSNFEYQKSVEPMKFSKLRIHKAYWVNLDDLLYCEQVELNSTNVKANEFNRFIKKWLEESDSQLEYLCVKMDYSTFITSLDGIPVTPLQQASTGKYFINFKDDHCFALERTNGEKAVILYEQFDSVILKTDSYRLS